MNYKGEKLQHGHVAVVTGVTSGCWTVVGTAVRFG